MIVINTISDMQYWSQACHTKGETIAFVPTMGNLHAGHLSLVESASKLADSVVVSIYVNPTQFAAHEDLENYPRTEAQDLKQLESHKVAAVFMPNSNEMYPPNKPIQYLDVPPIAKEYEGAARPEHFRGVVTIVKKLFDCVLPNYAVFGEKDFQQLLLVKNMVKQLGLAVEIHSAEIVRDADGLAKSSRNQYLTPEQRQKAPVIYKALQNARRSILENTLSYNEIELQSIDFIEKNGLAVDYFAIRDATDLAAPGNNNRVILAAARLGNTRLLDNLRVD